jgi:hypothetical protein
VRGTTPDAGSPAFIDTSHNLILFSFPDVLGICSANHKPAFLLSPLISSLAFPIVGLLSHPN